MLKAAWKDPVWSAVIAAGLVAVIGAVGTYILGLWPVITSAVSVVWNWLFASTKVANWLVLVLSLISIAAIVVVGLAIWHSSASSKATGPHWSNYTEDRFFGLRWRWGYAGGRIVDLHTFCPNCDYQVFPHNASPFSAVDRLAFTCDSCGRNLGNFDENLSHLESKAERFIQQKLRSSTWTTR